MCRSYPVGARMAFVASTTAARSVASVNPPPTTGRTQRKGINFMNATGSDSWDRGYLSNLTKSGQMFA
jgi:hypothetical protein